MFVSIFLSCTPEEEEKIGEHWGVRPIYLNVDALNPVMTLPPREFEDLGQIVTAGDFIYINERYEGIHVIDNSDPNNPTTLYFWQIQGNLDFTVSGNRLYTDNGFDLYTIDISDPSSIILLSTVENIYGQTGNTEMFPTNYSGFFECVDPALGIVVEWERALLDNPRCER